MKSEPDKSVPQVQSSTPSARTVPTWIRTSLWICLGAWALSFLLPAARIDISKAGGGAPAPGWAVAFDAITLLIVPVKGAWLGIFPALWTVFLNVFMLLVPMEIKAVAEGRGRVFTVMFSIGSMLPAVMAFMPALIGLGFPLLAGFYVWELSMIAASALFVRLLWGGTWSYMPAAVASVLLLCLPIERGDWKFAPEHQQPTATAQPQGLPPQMPDSVLPTTLIVDSSPNPSLSGEEVVFVARVSGSWGHSAPNGTVTFTDSSGNKLIGRVHTAGGTASVSSEALSTGEHGIRASFLADSSNVYLGSEASVVQVVQAQHARSSF